MSARVIFDDSRWPRVTMTWPAEPLSDEAFREMLARNSAYTHRGQPYVIIHDARKADRPTPPQRAWAAEQQRVDAEPARRTLRGVAVVVASALAAGAITAINWI